MEMLDNGTCAAMALAGGVLVLDLIQLDLTPNGALRRNAFSVQYAGGMQS